MMVEEKITDKFPKTKWFYVKDKLLIGHKVDIQKHKRALQNYLLKIKKQAEEEGYSGFAFYDDTK